MEVSHTAEDSHEENGRLATLRAKYDGPPPIPVKEAEAEAWKELGVKAAAHHADYIYQEGGETRLIPTTIIELPDGTILQVFPRLPPDRSQSHRGAAGGR